MAEAIFVYTFSSSFLPTFLLAQVRDAEACALFFFLAGNMKTCRDNVIGLSSHWGLMTNECVSSRCSSQILTWKLFIKLLHLRVVLKAERRGSVGCRSLTFRPSCCTLDRMEIWSSSVCPQLPSLNCTLTFNSCQNLKKKNLKFEC